MGSASSMIRKNMKMPTAAAYPAFSSSKYSSWMYCARDMDSRLGPPPVKPTTISYSFRPPIRLVTTQVVTEGISMGRVTRINRCQGDAPSISATSM